MRRHSWLVGRVSDEAELQQPKREPLTSTTSGRAVGIQSLAGRLASLSAPCPEQWLVLGLAYLAWSSALGRTELAVQEVPATQAQKKASECPQNNEPFLPL